MNNNYDLSVIIIGRNEAITLEMILRKFEYFSNNSSLSLQVLYVDSQSTDGSVELVSSYHNKLPNLGVIRLEGQLNAAIARNVGINSASGEFILFLDGDVVLNFNFIQNSLVLLEHNPNIGAVTGKLLEVFDVTKPEIFIERSHGNKNGKCCHLGGNFVCSRTTIEKVGFFDEKLTLNEDIDFTVRINNLGLDLVEINEVFGVHFTKPYNEINRLIQDLLHLNYVYPGILLRKYFFKRGFINIILSQSTIYFRFATVIIFILGFYFPFLFILFAAIFLFLTLRVKKHLNETLLSRTLSLLKGLQVAIGLFYVKFSPNYKIIKVI